ncbi:Chorismate mutase [Listeria monocytogenes]|nr:Chorismate mutase [Listeria monocytogenes]
MVNTNLEELRTQVDQLNIDLLELISKRANLVQEIGKIKGTQGSLRFDPLREREMLNTILAANEGPFEDSTVQKLFKEIFKAGLELQEITLKRYSFLEKTKKKSYSKRVANREWRTSICFRTMFRGIL